MQRKSVRKDLIGSKNTLEASSQSLNKKLASSGGIESEDQSLLGVSDQCNRSCYNGQFAKTLLGLSADVVKEGKSIISGDYDATIKGVDNIRKYYDDNTDGKYFECLVSCKTGRRTY